ncbi:MAG: glutamate--tRNA ligase family protein, partial [Promethearchaeota archaeon]
IMRISDAEHPRIGNKCRVWPLLDFSWAIDDHLLGVTHIIRGADLRKEGFMEEFIWDLLKWPKKEIILYGRLKFSKEFKLSKTEARLKIQRGEYDGWEDPRTWSLQSLRERGIRPQALREALIELGLSMSGINFSENWIYSKNTKLIDPIANRYWFVQDPIEIIITGLKEKEYLAHPLINPNNESLGTREVKLTVEQNQASVFISQLDIKEQRSRKGDKVRFHAMKIGDTFRLKDLFTIRITKMETTKNIIYAEYITSEPDKKIRKIQWVPKNHNYRTKVLKPDGIIWEGYAEGTVKELKLGTIIQFERYGFVRVKSNLNNLLYCYFAH